MLDALLQENVKCCKFDASWELFENLILLSGKLSYFPIFLIFQFLLNYSFFTVITSTRKSRMNFTTEP